MVHGYVVALVVFLLLRRAQPIFSATLVAFLCGVAACTVWPALLRLIDEGPEAAWARLQFAVPYYVPSLLWLLILLPLLGLTQNFAKRP